MGRGLYILPSMVSPQRARLWCLTAHSSRSNNACRWLATGILLSLRESDQTQLRNRGRKSTKCKKKNYNYTPSVEKERAITNSRLHLLWRRERECSLHSTEEWGLEGDFPWQNKKQKNLDADLNTEILLEGKFCRLHVL